MRGERTIRGRGRSLSIGIGVSWRVCAVVLVIGDGGF